MSVPASLKFTAAAQLLMETFRDHFPVWPFPVFNTEAEQTAEEIKSYAQELWLWTQARADIERYLFAALIHVAGEPPEDVYRSAAISAAFIRKEATRVMTFLVDARAAKRSP